MCVFYISVFVFPKVANASKWSEVSGNGKFVLDHRHYAHTHAIVWKRDVGRSYRALISVNLSVVFRSAFSSETLSTMILWHFLDGFLPPLAVEDLFGCQWVRRPRTSVSQGEYNIPATNNVEWKEPKLCKVSLYIHYSFHNTLLCWHIVLSCRADDHLYAWVPEDLLRGQVSLYEKEVANVCINLVHSIFIPFLFFASFYIFFWPGCCTVAITAHHIRWTMLVNQWENMTHPMAINR